MDSYDHKTRQEVITMTELNLHHDRNEKPVKPNVSVPPISFPDTENAVHKELGSADYMVNEPSSRVLGMLARRCKAEMCFKQVTHTIFSMSQGYS